MSKGWLVETLRQRVESLADENASLRQRNGNGNPPPQATPGNNGQDTAGHTQLSATPNQN